MITECSTVTVCKCCGLPFTEPGGERPRSEAAPANCIPCAHFGHAFSQPDARDGDGDARTDVRPAGNPNPFPNGRW